MLEKAQKEGDDDYYPYPCEGCLKQLTCVYYRINKKLRELELKKNGNKSK